MTIAQFFIHGVADIRRSAMSATFRTIASGRSNLSLALRSLTQPDFIFLAPFPIAFELLHHVSWLALEARVV